MKNNKSKKRDIFLLFVNIAIIICLGYISSFVFKRFDLTTEKRHSLTDTTKDLLKSLDEIVYIKVYLKGEFPADFQRLQKAVKEKLDEFRAYSGENLQYEFINPNESTDKKLRADIIDELTRKGLNYTTLQIRENDGITEKIVFPAALITHKGKEMPLQILNYQEQAPGPEAIGNSINNLEYELINIITQLKRVVKPKIAFTEGHGELAEIEVQDVTNSLSDFYSVSRVTLNKQINALSENLSDAYRKNKYDAIVIAQPDTFFDEADKYVIDQFIINGGKVIWLLDPMVANLDSLRLQQMAMSVSNDLNIDDQLFTYGVRLNKNILLDRSCAPIGLMTGPAGNQKMELFPWYFKPVIIPKGGHPITNNVDPIITDFVSGIDTISNAKSDIKKTILLTTSPYSRILNSPVRISLNIVKINPDFGNSNVANVPIAVLLEGKFTSVFQSRLSPVFTSQKSFVFREKGSSSKILVVADGDIIKNNVDETGTRFKELGYDRYAKKKIFGNKEFFLNAVNYMLGDASMISVRSRTILLRKLDDEKILANRTYYQAMNIGLPIVIVILLAIVNFFVRRKKFQL
jgi:ABC-2 type transport system permease protein